MTFLGILRNLAICLFLLVYQQTSCLEMSSDTSLLLTQTNITRFSARTVHMHGYHLHMVEHVLIIDAPELVHVAVEDLTKIPKLKSLIISQAPLLVKMATFPPLQHLRTLSITATGLLEVPNLSHVHRSTNESYMDAIYLDNNEIKRIPSHALRVRANHVTLNYNSIEEIPAFAFKDAVISKLSLRDNIKLSHIDDHAFADNLLIRQLDLSNTAITALPTAGLDKLEVLRIERTPSLTYIPSIYDLKNLQKAYLTHHFHCCAFDFPERHDPIKHVNYELELKFLAEKCGHTERAIRAPGVRRKRSLRKTNFKNPYTVADISIGTSTEEYDSDSTESNEDTTSVSSEETLSDSGSLEDMEDDLNFHEPVNSTMIRGTLLTECGNFSLSRRTVQCSPRPNALNPCEDVMGWTWLRVSVWIVIAAAVVGNLAVLIVLLANRSELTVPRFLMCHLALADLCTGLYLFMLAVVDLKSYGEFFNYAHNWQYGIGCKLSGFLSVFSGQLSVFTLTIITLERWFAITYAIYLERRISLAAAAKIMIGGWIFSILMAGLPLFGISDYSSTSICLPAESVGVLDTLYQGSLFLTNALAWVTIVVCYVQIYRSLGGRGETYGGRGAAAAAERRMANKMALLVGTDLLCWAPVAFFGVTAMAGVPLVDVSHAKVLLVFFYPLNACANPFLYAILTKQYRRDLLFMIARNGRCQWLVAKYKLAATAPQTADTTVPAPLLPMDLYKRHGSQSKEQNGDAKV